MKPSFRGAIPFLLTALALANAGCGSRAPERSPTSPTDPAAESDSKGVRAMAVAPSLGAADSFAVLASSTVTNIGPTVVNGDLGLSPNGPASITGFPPGLVTGTTEAANAASLAAQNSITIAFNSLAAQPCDLNLTGTNLGGLTLTPATYCFNNSAQLTGTLTLNGLGNPGAVWVFQIGSTLTTASGSTVAFINAGQSCGAFWQVGSSATLGTTTSFGGNILALASITMNTGAVSDGGLFARTAAVTLDSNTVNRVGSCGAGPPPPTPTPLPTPTPGVPTLPEGVIWGLAAILLAGGVFVLGRR